MKRSNSLAKAICACAICLAMGAAVQRARADTLQVSAFASSVSVSLTLQGATFPSGPPFFNPGSVAHISGYAGPQSYDTSVGGSLLSSHSVGPLQVSDPATASMAQSAASDAGALSNGNQTFTILTTTSATSTSAFAGGAEGDAGSAGLPPGVVLLPFPQPTPAIFDIDLISDYGANSSAAYSVQTSASGGDIPANHSARANLVTSIESNIPGLSTIFSFQPIESWQNGSSSLTIQFSSPLIAQPIFASDFIAGPDGSYSLDAAKRHISIPFTIPAGLSFQFETGTAMRVDIVPEPSAIVLVMAALFALAALCRRRARR